MSTYVLMRLLESAPRRYERGIRLLTLGRLDKAYDRLVAPIEPGQRVLDIGCGTGALTLRAARRGATVKGIDINPEMLEIAKKAAGESGLADSIDFIEMGVAELDREEPGSYDGVMSGLCFSELSADELAYTLAQILRILKPGGYLLVADEVRPEHWVTRLLQSLIRLPLTALTYVFTQQTTHPIANLSQELTEAGLLITSVESSPWGSFATFVARKPGDRAR